MYLEDAVDMSKWGGDFTDAEAQEMKANGIKTVIVATGPGGYGTQAKQQADTAHRNGLRLEAYYFIEWGKDPDWWIKAGKEALGEASQYVERVWIDVEDVSNPFPGLVEAIAYISAFVQSAHAWYMQAEVGICTARWYWADPKYMNNVSNFSFMDLWNAWYDGDPDMDGLPYGGWNVSAIEQFGGTQIVAGQSVDINKIYKYPSKNLSGVVEVEGMTVEQVNTAMVKRLTIIGLACVVDEQDTVSKIYDLLKANGFIK